jgi:DNA-binding ferritin-like protein
MEIKFKEKPKKEIISSKPDVIKETKEVALFLSHLLGCISVLRIQHLQVTNKGSYAAHKALQEAYELVEEKFDLIAEVFQGYYDVIIDGYTTYPIEKYYKMKPVDYIKYQITFIENSKSTFKDNSAILNILDEFIASLSQIRYKLSKLE